MLRPLNNNSLYISLCRTSYLAQGDLGETLRVYYGAKELLVEKEIPQSMLTIRHAPHFPESIHRIIAKVQHLKMPYQELTVCQGGKTGLAIKLFQEEKNYAIKTTQKV